MKEAQSWRKKSRKGATMIEIMGGLAIIGFIAIIAIGMYAIASRDAKVTSTFNNMQLLNTKINEMYMQEPSFDGLTGELLIKSGNVPANMINSKRDGLRSYWGDIDVQPASSDAGTDDVFSLTFDNIPLEVCLRLGTVVRSSNVWQSVEIGSASYDTVDNQDDNLVEFLSDACEATNSMIFTSRRQ